MTTYFNIVLCLSSCQALSLSLYLLFPTWCLMHWAKDSCGWPYYVCHIWRPCLLRKLTSTSLCVFPYGCDWLVPARGGVAVRCDLSIIYLIYVNTTGNDTRTTDLSFPQSALYGMPIHTKKVDIIKVDRMKYYFRSRAIEQAILHMLPGLGHRSRDPGDVHVSSR